MKKRRQRRRDCNTFHHEYTFWLRRYTIPRKMGKMSCELKFFEIFVSQSILLPAISQEKANSKKITGDSTPSLVPSLVNSVRTSGMGKFELVPPMPIN
jgi:hypothetical protein